MGDHAEKNRAGGTGFSEKGSCLSFREPNNEERNYHHLNRTGCISRPNLTTKSTHNSSSEKLKNLEHPLRFRSSNPSAASSSRSFSSSSSSAFFSHDRNNGKLLEEANIAEFGNGQGEAHDVLHIDLEFRERKKVVDCSGGLNSPVLHRFPANSIKTRSSFKVNSSSKSGKQIIQSSANSSQNNANPPLHQPSVPKNAVQMTKSLPQCAISKPQRHVLKNLGCGSISDALHSNSSSSGHNKRACSLRNKFHDGEGSSSGRPSYEEQQLPEDASIKTKRQYKNRDAKVPVRTCLSAGGWSSKMRSSEEEDEHYQLLEPILFPRRLNAPLRISGFSQERPLMPFDFSYISPAGRPRSSSPSSRRRAVAHSDDGDDYLHMFMEGVAEVLQVLERVEHDVGLTAEELMMLETNILEGFSFYDQHRDMRLDIDNMSYEELLALEEKMGSVSTALTEEALSKCIKKSSYGTSFLRVPGISSHGDNDFKCSICQEEYKVGEELGRLRCNHHYHASCVQQWLKLKNWCPICKAPALRP